jgi:uncharacterized protein DUF5995
MSRNEVVPMSPRSDIAAAVELRTRDLGRLTAVDGVAAVDEVLRVLTDLQDVLAGSGSPAAGFHHLYVATTTEVARRLAADAFEAPAFICALDARFAVRYLSALRATAIGAEVPRSWAVVLDPREEASLMARAAAGVNAHINFDLPFALLAALRDVPVFPAEQTSPEYRDYLQVNEIFYALLPEALDFTVGHDGFLSWLYRLADVRDNAEELIEVARRVAWLVCENHLWPIPAAEVRSLRRRESWIDWLVSRLGAEMLGPAGHLIFGGTADAAA